MAVQILNRPSLSDLIGKGLGEGINKLAQGKMESLQKRRGLAHLFPDKAPEDIKSLADLPDDLLQQVIKNYQAQQQAESFAKILASQTGQGGQASQVDQASQGGQVGQADQAGQGGQVVGNFDTKSDPGDVIGAAQKPPTGAQEPGISRELYNAAQPPIQAKDKLNALLQSGMLGSLNQHLQKMAIDTLLGQQKITDRDKQAAQKEEQFKEKLGYTETRDYRKDVAKRARNAQKDLRNLRLQEDLVNTNKLIGPKENMFLDYVGSKFGFTDQQIGALKNSESQVFEKLSVPFFRSLKEMFGGMPTKFDAQQLQKGFPSLYQTDAGKKVIISISKMDAKKDILEDKIKKETIREHGGSMPTDLEDRVQERLEPYVKNQYNKITNKISDVMAEYYGPDVPASSYDKGVMLEDKQGRIFISDGKNWKYAIGKNINL